ncbi:hypothetical protein scyTo_0006452, partial [Scyliorhinus torazame]|nr:hypothetical protein [Scyliorhinus torazame]
VRVAFVGENISVGVNLSKEFHIIVVSEARESWQRPQCLVPGCLEHFLGPRPRLDVKLIQLLSVELAKRQCKTLFQEQWRSSSS